MKSSVPLVVICFNAFFAFVVETVFIANGGVKKFCCGEKGLSASITSFVRHSIFPLEKNWEFRNK